VGATEIPLPTGRATIKDVARLAGVSPATVSRVVNGTAAVSAAKCEAVARAVAETGFLATSSARQLATGRSDSLAVILTEPVDELLSDPTFATILKGVMDGLTATRLMPVLFMASTPSEREKSVRMFGRRAADAIVHLSPYTDDGLLEELSELGVPAVLCGQLPDLRWAGVFSAVYADDVSAAAAAGAYLAESGTRRAAAHMGPESNPATRDRVAGYRDALGEQLVRVDYCAGWRELHGRTAARQLLAEAAGLDTLVCGNDSIARGAVDALAEAGVTVPGGVRVMGFDDHPVAAWPHPSISTVHQPFHEQGVRAVEVACAMIEGAAPRCEVLPTRLVLRETA
jgi:DNA-binding LacI/PurR family transcriptional regulator